MVGLSGKIGVIAVLGLLVCAGAARPLRADELDCTEAKPVHDVLTPSRVIEDPNPRANTTIAQKHVPAPEIGNSSGEGSDGAGGGSASSAGSANTQ